MKNKAISINLLSVISFFMLSALILIGISFLPFDFVKAKLDSLAVDGRSDIFNTVLYNRIAKFFRYIGAALSFICVLFYIYRYRAQQLVLNISISSVIFLKDIKRYLTNATKDENRAHLFLLLAICLSGALIRLLYISRPMHMDECFTFTNCASNPFYMCLSQYVANNHVFHTLLVRSSYLLFGNHSWALRLPAFLGGILLIPACYITACVYYDKYAALLTTVFISFSTVLISFSVNARGYTIWCLFVLLILALGVYLKQSAGLFPWIVFAIFSALGFYTQPLMVYPFGIVAVWLFLSIIAEKKDRDLKQQLIKRLTVFSLLTLIITCMLYLPIIIVSGVRPIIENSRVVPNILLHKNSFILAWRDWNYAVPLPVQFLLITGFFISIFFHRRIANRRISIILPAVVWIPVPLMLITRPHDYSRYWLFLFPLYAMLASAGISFILRPLYRYKKAYMVFIVILSAYLAFNLINTNSVYYFRDPREKLFYDAEDIALFFKEKDILGPGDIVFSFSPTILEYYFYKHNIPSQYFKTDLEKSGRVFVVPENSGDLTKNVLERYGLDSAKYAYPREIRRFKSSILYEVAHRVKDSARE